MTVICYSRNRVKFLVVGDPHCRAKIEPTPKDLESRDGFWGHIWATTEVSTTPGCSGPIIVLLLEPVLV